MEPYHRLSISALRNGLQDLLEHRLAFLLLALSGQAYQPAFRNCLNEIEELPETILTGKPLAELLKAQDRIHDAFATAVWHVTEAYLTLPELEPAIRLAIERIRAEFVPERGLTRVSWDKEAEAAQRRLPGLETFAAELRAIPIAPTGSLYDWTATYLKAGVRLGELLGQKADPTGSHPASRSALLRSNALGLLNRCRAAIADELASNPALPPDLDAQIFGYLDQLEAQTERG